MDEYIGEKIKEIDELYENCHQYLRIVFESGKILEISPEYSEGINIYETNINNEKL